MLDLISFVLVTSHRIECHSRIVSGLHCTFSYGFIHFVDCVILDYHTSQVKRSCSDDLVSYPFVVGCRVRCVRWRSIHDVFPDFVGFSKVCGQG